jgi:hypothetical protein
MAQAVELLPCKHEALSSNTSSAKNKRKKKEKKGDVTLVKEFADRSTEQDGEPRSVHKCSQPICDTADRTLFLTRGAGTGTSTSPKQTDRKEFGHRPYTLTKIGSNRSKCQISP